MNRAAAVLLSAGILASTMGAKADETYRLCGANAVGFARAGKYKICIEGGEGSHKSAQKLPEWVTVNQNLKYRQIPALSCRIGDECSKIEVVSKRGCSYLYASAAKLDSTGRNVGYTNDSSIGVRPNQIAVLEFSSEGPLEINEITCRN